jgi:hypothetical protein
VADTVTEGRVRLPGPFRVPGRHLTLTLSLTQYLPLILSLGSVRSDGWVRD